MPIPSSTSTTPLKDFSVGDLSTTTEFIKSSRPCRPPLLVTANVLAHDYCHRLFDTNLNSDKNRIIAANLLDPTSAGSSISPVISSRFVFQVGGIYIPADYEPFPFLTQHPSPKVFFLDLQTSSSSPIFNQGPPLLFPKSFPTLIPMGSKLFAFPKVIDISSRQLIEGLDTDSRCWTWCPVSPLPILLSVLSPPHPDRSYSFIISYAASQTQNILFLCLGDYNSRDPYNKGLVSLNYDYTADAWGDIFSDGLPFYGQGQFCNDLCYAFPCGLDKCNPCFISCYRLDNPSLTSLPSSWVEVTRYTLPYGPLGHYYPYLQSFSLLSEYFILMIRARSTGYNDGDPHSLELDLIQLHKELEKSSILIHRSHLHQFPFESIVGSYRTSPFTSGENLRN